MKPEWQEKCASCKRRGAVTQLWVPSAHPNACLFPKRPNHGPSLQKNRRKK